jgi:hypothetical protein
MRATSNDVGWASPTNYPNGGRCPPYMSAPANAEKHMD